MEPSILGHTKRDIDLSQEHKDYTPEFILTGLIKKEGKNILVAERGSGKTRLSLWIAYSIIYECEEVLGYKIKIFGDVLFINLEIAEKDFKAFIDPIINYFENHLQLVKKHNLFITSFKEGGCKTSEISLAVEKFHPILTIIDSYKIFQSLICQEQGKTDINNSNFNLVIDPLDDLIKKNKTTILLINHTNKGTSKAESNADLMYGPGALSDFVDHLALLRKTINPNERIIVPDKSRYSGEGYITTNLIRINSTDPLSPYPQELYFELLEMDVNEMDYTQVQSNNRIEDEIKEKIIDFIVNKKGTMEEAAYKFLGNKTRKGTVSKIMKKYNETLC